MEKRYGKKRTLRLRNRLGKVEGALWKKNRGNSLKKASVDKRCGKRGILRFGNRLRKVEITTEEIVEIACKKHRWIRDLGRDGCCSLEIV